MVKLERKSDVAHLQTGKPSDGPSDVGQDLVDRSLAAAVRRLLQRRTGRPEAKIREATAQIITKHFGTVRCGGEDGDVDWIWRTGPDNRFIYFAEKTPGSLLGRESSVLGRTRWEVADVSENPQAWEQHRQDLENRRPFKGFRYSPILNNGVVRHIEVSGEPMYADDGAFIGYTGTAKEVFD